MLFDSFDFVFFFVLITALYFTLPHRFRWLLLLLGSCYFYMTFIPIYILILFFTILVDYFAAIWIEDSVDARKKRWFLLVSVVSVCATLFVFKYFNFFSDNISSIAAAFHWNYGIAPLRIILPIGLSFHTFQSLSYVIEVYRGNQRAERHFGIYALYVMYFPQLVAGPIERPQNILHQFHEVKRLDWGRIRDGLSLALWGLFKKVVVADCLAIYVNTIYNAAPAHSGASLLLATYFFTFQIYCDFSGYSDMARGISRVYGIELMKNFETPYFAASIGEFWARWHISLSTWFRDYVYIPLGGSRTGPARNCGNLFFVFLLSGFWHGANWTFLAWGALHGTYLVVERLTGFGKHRRGAPAGTPANKPESAFFRRLLTFHLVLISWVFFRAPNIHSALSILRKMATDRGPLFNDPIVLQGVLAICLLLVVEILFRRFQYWESPQNFPLGFRSAFTVALLFAVVLFGIDSGSQFIYFQF